MTARAGVRRWRSLIEARCRLRLHVAWCRSSHAAPRTALPGFACGPGVAGPPDALARMVQILGLLRRRKASSAITTGRGMARNSSPAAATQPFEQVGVDALCTRTVPSAQHQRRDRSCSERGQRSASSRHVRVPKSRRAHPSAAAAARGAHPTALPARRCGRSVCCGSVYVGMRESGCAAPARRRQPPRAACAATGCGASPRPEPRRRGARRRRAINAARHAGAAGRHGPPSPAAPVAEQRRGALSGWPRRCHRRKTHQVDSRARCDEGIERGPRAIDQRLQRQLGRQVRFTVAGQVGHPDGEVPG